MLKIVKSLQEKPPQKKDFVNLILLISLKDPFQEPIQNDLLVTRIASDYNLLLNKFPVHQYHTILTTRKFEK